MGRNLCGVCPESSAEAGTHPGQPCSVTSRGGTGCFAPSGRFMALKQQEDTRSNAPPGAPASPSCWTLQSALLSFSSSDTQSFTLAIPMLHLLCKTPWSCHNPLPFWFVVRLS